MSEKASQLASWLNSIIGKDKDYHSNLEVAGLTELSEGTIRNLRKGLRASRMTVEKLADGLPYSRSFILIKAGILSEAEERNIWIEILAGIFARLPEGDQQVLLKTAQAMLEKSDQPPTED